MESGTLFRILLALLFFCNNVRGKEASAFLQLNPEKVVVEYGGSVSVNCSKTNSTNETHAWESPEGTWFTTSDPLIITWTVKNVTEFGIKPICYLYGIYQDFFPNITVYKRPDKVFIRNHNETLIEGKDYSLMCEVVNVAPGKLVTVNWYNEENIVKSENFSKINKVSQVDVTSTLTFTANRIHNGINFKCEAVLELGPEGPQPSPTLTSEPLRVEVLYPPSNILELEDKSVYRDEDVVLKCSSSANPSLTYSWEYYIMPNVKIEDVDGVSQLHITKANRLNTGSYTCIARNDIGSKTLTVRVDVKGTEKDCPLTLSTTHLVLEYGKSENVTCTAPVNSAVSWDYINTTVSNTNLLVNSLDLVKWDKQPSCYGNFNKDVHCNKSLKVTVYKYPDTVSLKVDQNSFEGIMYTKTNYTLQCNVINVAPVQHLTVNWYKRGTQVKTETFKFAPIKAPTNQLSALQITPSPGDNGVEYMCEAALRETISSILQAPNPWFSEPLKLNVYYKPVINRTKLPETTPVIKGFSVVLVCEADGNPKPSITWIFSNQTRVEAANITVLDVDAEYRCIAVNTLGNDTQIVKVEKKEDYLPLIAGLVALAVAVISVIFIIIYCIYYKNTRMGQYTLKGAKPNAQNGNVAQNGRDSSIPMKTIPQNSV